ncbi:histidine utilization repressor [Pararhizobium gei]|uniref:histidine utilization repressor n=1 Tax=Pararhizobium gei TaxID=1395951 RepID=UPI0023DA74B8|nr:histidine utilization repressor [Rhizobium gei]
MTHIGSGAWDKSRKLPSEHDLVATLGVSRMTVHRALRELTSAGYLLRIQGVGTFVAPPKPQSTLIEVANIATEIAGRGGEHHAEVILLETIKPEIELLAAFEAGGQIRVAHSIVVHFDNGIPVQVEERFVNSELVPDYDQQDFAVMTTYDYLQRSTPMTEVEHVISAIGADAQTARMLELDEGSPCLLLHRRTWSGAKVATVNRLTYSGNRYSLGSRYAPSSLK